HVVDFWLPIIRTVFNNLFRPLCGDDCQLWRSIRAFLFFGISGSVFTVEQYSIEHLMIEVCFQNPTNMCYWRSARAPAFALGGTEQRSKPLENEGQERSRPWV